MILLAFACGGPTALPPAPGSPPSVGPDPTADTAPPPSTPPTPPTEPCEPSCVVGGTVGMDLGGGGFAGFVSFDQLPVLEFQGDRARLTVRVEGIELSRPVTTVFRVGRPDRPTVDTIAARMITCEADGAGWLTGDIAVPDDLDPGDPLELTVSFTDDQGGNANKAATVTVGG